MEVVDNAQPKKSQNKRPRKSTITTNPPETLKQNSTPEDEVIHSSQLPSTSAITESSTPLSEVRKDEAISFLPPSQILTSKRSVEDLSGNVDNCSKEAESKSCVQKGGNQNKVKPESKPELQEQVEDKTAKKTCPWYIASSCRYGITGKGCPFDHPERCKKLLQFGTRTPNGCNKGKKCGDFHPKMCPASITKNLCLDTKCKYSHVKGSWGEKAWKRANKPPDPPKSSGESTNSKQAKKVLPVDHPPVTAPDNQTSKSQEPFLELRRLIREEMLEAMDKRIALALSQLPQIHHQMPFQQHPMMNYHHMPMPYYPMYAPLPPHMQVQQMTSHQPNQHIVQS